MAIRPGCELPAGAESRPIPAARYAVFECGVDSIGPTWKYAYETWLPASPFIVDSAAIDFEYYLPVGADGIQKVEIYIPIRDK
jgi:predicted transcriptional regulator YdeE